MKILVLDVGGNHVKIAATGRKTPVKVDSGPKLTPEKMVSRVKAATAGWKYDAVSIGFPAPVVRNRPAEEPRNLGRGWVGFDFAKAFGKPVRIINDAAMQALGSYEGGRMLFLGLGTGLGAALVIDGVLQPLELGSLPYKKGRDIESYVGAEGLKWMGKKKWRHHVSKAVRLLKEAMQADYVLLGGGNVKKLKELPPGARRGSNSYAFPGGLRLWGK